jgi:hypothetical protein
MISTQKLKDAERVVPITMIVILLTAGSSKFFSNGAFFDYIFLGLLYLVLPAHSSWLARDRQDNPSTSTSTSI